MLLKRSANRKGGKESDLRVELYQQAWAKEKGYKLAGIGRKKFGSVFGGGSGEKSRGKKKQKKKKKNQSP